MQNLLYYYSQLTFDFERASSTLLKPAASFTVSDCRGLGLCAPRDCKISFSESIRFPVGIGGPCDFGTVLWLWNRVSRLIDLGVPSLICEEGSSLGESDGAVSCCLDEKNFAKREPPLLLVLAEADADILEPDPLITKLSNAIVVSAKLLGSLANKSSTLSLTFSTKLVETLKRST